MYMIMSIKHRILLQSVQTMERKTFFKIYRFICDFEHFNISLNVQNHTENFVRTVNHDHNGTNIIITNEKEKKNKKQEKNRPNDPLTIGRWTSRARNSPDCQHCPRSPCRLLPWSWWPRTSRCWCWPWPRTRWTPSWSRAPWLWALVTIAAVAAAAAWTGWAYVGRRRTWSGVGAGRWTRWRWDRFRGTPCRNWKSTMVLANPAPTSSREPPPCGAACQCRWPRRRHYRRRRPRPRHRRHS